MMDSLLPTFHRPLPQPQLFVDLRRIKAEENSKEKKLDISQRRNTEGVEFNAEVKPAVQIFPKKKSNKEFKIRNISNKLKTLYQSKEQDGIREKIKQPFGHKFPFKPKSKNRKPNSYSCVSHCMNIQLVIV